MTELDVDRMWIDHRIEDDPDDRISGLSCPDCFDTGWTEEWDPLHPEHDDDGYVLVACGCPAGNDLLGFVHDHV